MQDSSPLVTCITFCYTTLSCCQIITYALMIKASRKVTAPIPAAPPHQSLTGMLRPHYGPSAPRMVHLVDAAQIVSIHVRVDLCC